MRTLLSYFVFLVFMFTYGSVAAREKESMDMIRANYHYSHLAFYKAIPYYEKIAADSTDNNNKAQIFAKLADCYRLTGDVTKAADNYRKALERPMFGGVVMLRYGQTLMMLSHYDTAILWLKKYQKLNPTDKRVANLIAGCVSAPDRLKAAVNKEPVLLGFNTDHSEFAPVLWQGNLVFTSDTAIHQYKKQSSWTSNACYSMYSVLCDANGNCDVQLTSLTTEKDMAWHDGPGTFSADGDTMYFTRTKYEQKFFSKGTVANDNNTVVLETMVATDYDAATNRFKHIKPFVFNNRNYAVVHPAISPNGTMLVFSSTMQGSGSDLYLCLRNKKGKWLRPQTLGIKVNTEGEELFPFFANDTTLFFASDGHEGLGGLDIYMTHMDSTKHTCSDPVNVGAPINSPYDDISMALSADGSGGYFSSNRPAAKGSDNVYYYRGK